MQAAAEHKGNSLKILAVTVLTSIDRADLDAMGIGMDVAELTVARATQAIATGCDGIIASGLEAERLRGVLGGGPVIVTPGIRPAADRGGDDQKRVVTASDALRAGADYLVIGRPIRGARDPRSAAEMFQREIATVFE
jgi:orotidine-5'-phosphate decarboxylase